MAVKTDQTKVDREVKVRDASGKETNAVVVLPGSIFDVALNVPLIHQVVEAQRAARRAGTAATKTRAMVSGGGKKPWRQKGTGRARHGSIRAPQWKGGGIVHGPQPRSYNQRTPKKMTAGALRSALSDRARKDAIYVFSSVVEGEKPSTKAALETLGALDVAGQTLVVVDRDQDDVLVARKSYGNIPKTKVVEVGQLAVYDVMKADQLAFTSAALDSYVERVRNSRGWNESGADAKAAAPAKEASEDKGKAAGKADTSDLKEDKAKKDSGQAEKKVEKAKEESAKDAKEPKTTGSQKKKEDEAK